MKKMSAYSSISMLVILLFIGILFSVVMVPVFYGKGAMNSSDASFSKSSIDARVNVEVSDIEYARKNIKREEERYSQEY